jgi:hypothetical protein
MKVGVAIQLNHTREEELLEFQMSLREIGVEPIYYGLIPFSDEITGAEGFADYDAVIVYGTVKLIRLWQKGLMPKGTTVFYSEPAFDQFNYSLVIPKHMLLNGEAKISTLGKIKDDVFLRPIFAKPTRDLKAFAGVIVEPGRTIGEEVYGRPQDSSLTEDEVVLYGPLKNIVKEYRNFVVDSKIIDSSTYKIGSKVTYEVPSEAERKMIAEFFEEVIGYYEPHDVYVVDFALLDTGEMVVIEYNCWNCAGMYSVDRRKVFKAVIDFVSQ